MLSADPDTNPPDIVQNSFLEQRAANAAFSLCFGHNGGYFTLGNYNKTHHLAGAAPEELRYDRSQGQFKVTLLSLYVAPAHHRSTS